MSGRIGRDLVVNKVIGECNFCVGYRTLQEKTFKCFFYEIFYIRQNCKGGNKRVIDERSFS